MPKQQHKRRPVCRPPRGYRHPKQSGRSPRSGWSNACTTACTTFRSGPCNAANKKVISRIPFDPAHAPKSPAPASPHKGDRLSTAGTPQDAPLLDASIP